MDTPDSPCKTPTPPREASGSAPTGSTTRGGTPSPLPGALSARHAQMKRFARSADKRQSVHMLGSIQHLQRHFMKFGIESEQNDTSPSSRLASAPSFPTDADEPEAEPPVPPATVAKPPFPLFKTPKVDLAQLKRDAWDGLRRMEEAWGIQDDLPPLVTEENESSSPVAASGTKILDLIKVTIDAVRAVRAWSLAIPLPSDDHQAYTSPGTTRSTKPRILSSISTPSRPAATVNGSRSISGSALFVGGTPDEVDRRDPFQEVRKRALDVLVCLRGVEERFRVQEVGESSFESETDGGPSTTAVRHRRQRSDSNPDPVDDLWVFSERFNQEPEWTEDDKKSWYDRLAQGQDGWVYRDDVEVGEELGEEVQVVQRYLMAVARAFSDGEGGPSPWRVPGGVDSRDEDVFGGPVGDAGHGHGEGGERVLPSWAEEQGEDGGDERILAFMQAHLPAGVILSSDADPNRLLSRLSDGYLLILAFNTALRHAAGSWGFIREEDVHDTSASNGDSRGDGEAEEGGEGDGVMRKPRDWTFRRAGNLRSWGAAIKTRYNVPLVFPIQAVDPKPTAMSFITTTGETTPSRQEGSPVPSRRASGYDTGGTGVEGIPFDPVRLARREEGWDVTLRRVITAWIDKVVAEMQG